MADDAPIWDVHHHWVNEAGYIDRLLREMDRLGIERTGLIAMGDLMPDLFLERPRQGCCGNEDLAQLVARRRDRFWGWGFIQLGRHLPDDVDRLVQMGMSGLKFHLPLAPYSHPDYWPVYAKAAEHRLPCLFHTGVVWPPKPMPGAGIWSENYRPMHVERIAHDFPQLKIICAHLGVGFNEEAATLCRICPNIHADLSGRVGGWRSGRSPQWFSQTFYWPTAHKKILFGSDVHCQELAQTIDDHRRILAAMGWTGPRIDDVMGQNARQMIGS